jgi:hypothetical protein
MTEGKKPDMSRFIWQPVDVTIEPPKNPPKPDPKKEPEDD